MSVISLTDFKRAKENKHSSHFLEQRLLKNHEKRAMGDIQTNLVQIGFSKDPHISFMAYPHDTDVYNRMTLHVDVALPRYQKIFGEYFDIIITKYGDLNNNDCFCLETPLQKSSGDFSDVIRLVETFINTNLHTTHKPIKTLICAR